MRRSLAVGEKISLLEKGATLALADEGVFLPSRHDGRDVPFAIDPGFFV